MESNAHNLQPEPLHEVAQPEATPAELRRSIEDQLDLGGSDAVLGLRDLDELTRLRLAELVKRFETAAEALPAAVELLAGANAAKNEAIVQAIDGCEPLRLQWESAFSTLSS